MKRMFTLPLERIREGVWDNLSQRTILIVFVALNSLLMAYSVPEGPYVAAADVSVSVEAARGLIEGQGFAHPDGRIFTWGMPLYPAFLAIFLALLPWKAAIYAIVVAQCLLLYLIGLATRDLASFYSSKVATLAQILLLFNPNVLISAHLLQTEVLFTLFLSASVVVILRYGAKPSLAAASIAGALIGLATLVRPAGQFVIVLLPLMFVLSGRRNEGLKLRSALYAGLVASVLAMLTIAPWIARNQIHFGTPFLTTNAGLYLAAQYRQLLHTGHGMAEADTLLAGSSQEQGYLGSVGRRPEGIRDLPQIEQSRILSATYAKAILEQPPFAHARAFIESWVQLYFGGGASNIKNYLGLDSRKSIVQFERESRSSFLDAISKFVSRVNSSYAAILLLTFGYTVVARLAGIGGLIKMLRKETVHATLAVMVVMVVLSLSYLFIGQSRFRVPLEPYLAVMAALGLLALKEWFCKALRRGTE